MYNFTPLHVACTVGHYEVVKYLLDHGANINHIAETDEGQKITPLLSACMGYFEDSKKIEIIKLLLEYGADAGVGGTTPLHLHVLIIVLN